MKFFFLFFSLLLSWSLFAQENKLTIQDRYLRNELHLSGKGLVLFMNRTDAESKDEVYFFSPRLQLVYKTPIERKAKKDFRSFLFSSPEAEYVYHVEPYTNKKLKLFFVTQIDSIGNRKTFEFENIKDAENPGAFFADDQNAYYFTRVPMEDGKKNEVKYILLQFNNQTFNKKIIELDLPGEKDDKNSSYWNYAGNSKGKIYFESKTISEPSDYFFEVRISDREGSILKEQRYEVVLNKTFPRPSDHTKKYDWVKFWWEEYTGANDRDFIPSISEVSKGMTYYPLLSAFGDIMFDEGTGSAYIYGLKGPKPFTTLGSSYTGYFIFKYDGEGKLVWKKEHEFPIEIKDNTYFTKNAIPYRRRLNLEINKDGSMRFGIYGKGFGVSGNEDLYLLNLDKEGNYISIYHDRLRDRNDNHSIYAITSAPEEVSEEVKKLYSNSFKAIKGMTYSLYRFEEGDIVIEKPEYKNSFTLFTVKHKK